METVPHAHQQAFVAAFETAECTADLSTVSTEFCTNTVTLRSHVLPVLATQHAAIEPTHLSEDGTTVHATDFDPEPMPNITRIIAAFHAAFPSTVFAAFATTYHSSDSPSFEATLIGAQSPTARSPVFSASWETIRPAF